ncbi:hypothetical protein [Embleya sp. NPDC050493]|uniref:hypothetical protein n=1 Tax=Embleya sp. NPDC050493 TaxID=3363989 RepID=UPI0037AFD987
MELSVVDAGLWVSVRDDGCGIEAAGGAREEDGAADEAGKDTGFGIVGMAERACSVGGTLVAGPGAEGGFRVEAVLPMGERAGAG